MRNLLFTLIVVFAFILPASAQDNVVRLVTHDSFNVSEAVLDQFESETGLTVEILRIGDAGSLVNQSILTIENPLGDVLYGIDNTFLTRALNADLFVPYISPVQPELDESYLDSEGRVTPIDYGDVCLNYDAAYFDETGLAVPDSLDDLTAPEYAGLLAVINPATSSPGLAFLMATVAVFGEEGDYTYLDFWSDLVANDVYIADDWTDAYYGRFSGSAGSEGNRPLVVSYASSPPVEVYFMELPPAAGEPAPTGAITAPDTCFRQIEYAGVLTNAANPEGAQRFIDFMLSTPFQEDVPLQMFVFPVNEEAQLPQVFIDHASIPEQSVIISVDEIDANRERWIQEWTESVLR